MKALYSNLILKNLAAHLNPSELRNKVLVVPKYLPVNLMIIKYHVYLLILIMFTISLLNWKWEQDGTLDEINIQ